MTDNCTKPHDSRKRNGFSTPKALSIRNLVFDLGTYQRQASDTVQEYNDTRTEPKWLTRRWFPELQNTEI